MNECNASPATDHQAQFDAAECLADEAAVRQAISAVAAAITRDLRDLDPVLLCVMKGGLVFAGQLLTQLRFPLLFDYVHATRYGNETSGGELTWRVAPAIALQGRHVLLVDDILDVGVTLEAIRVDCLQRGALSVRTAVLVDKCHNRKVRAGMLADYTGLQMPDRYLFGYGMDCEGYWRNAPGIFALREEPACSP